MLDIFDERMELREAAKKAKMQSGTMGLKEGFAPHILDAMEILYEVWQEIVPSKIKNCWRKSTLVSFDKSIGIDVEIEIIAKNNENDMPADKGYWRIMK